MKPVKVLRLFKNDYVIDDLNSEELDVVGYKYNEVIHDRQGNVLEEIRYTSGGEVEERTVNRYDGNGFLTEEWYYAGDEEPAEHKTYERDEEGRVLREIKHYLDGSQDITSYTYDEQGHLLEKQMMNSDDELEGKEIYTFHDGKLVHYRVLNEDEGLLSEKEIAYDEAGRITSATERYPDDFHRARIVEVFDGEGRRSQTLRYNGHEQLVEKVTYIWADGEHVGQIVEETPYGVTTSHYTYDEEGYLTLQESFDRGNNLVARVERTYGDDHQLIESRVFIDGQGRGISQNYDIKYEYEYFED